MYHILFAVLKISQLHQVIQRCLEAGYEAKLCKKRKETAIENWDQHAHRKYNHVERPKKEKKMIELTQQFLSNYHKICNACIKESFSFPLMCAKYWHIQPMICTFPTHLDSILKLQELSSCLPLSRNGTSMSDLSTK